MARRASACSSNKANLMTADFSAGNYRFIPAVFQYSAGSAALPGYEIERVRFHQWLPLGGGFAPAPQIYSGRGPAPDVLLCLRTAFARRLHRRRFPQVQRALRQDAGRMGYL